MAINIAPEELANNQGFYLFPCDGKKPLVKWSAESTIDIPTIERWATRFPNCNWGVDCGKSGIVVLDDDRGKNEQAIASMNALEIEYGLLPNTFTVRTVSGGYHYYYYGTGRNSASGALGVGIDSRGAGGFVVAPCSPGWEVVKNSPIVDAPEWFLDLIGEPTERSPADTIPLVELDSPAAVSRALSYLSQVEPAVEGAGGDAFTLKVALQVKDFGVSQEKCLDLMLDHWDQRCSPPWGAMLETKVENAYRYGKSAPGILAPEAAFESFDDKAVYSPLFIEANALLSREIKIDYLIHGLIETPSTGLIFGDPSSGKSFLAIDMACAIACGTQWMGGFAKQGIAVYFAGEGRHGVQRRIAAWRNHYNITIPDNHLWVSEKRIEFSDKSLKGVADELKTIQDKTGQSISACYVDTLARHMPSASDENSARDMGGFINAVDWLRDQFNSVVAVVHHSGKMNKDTSRGSSAIRGAMDWEFKVDNKKGLRAVFFTKQKESELPEPMGFTLTQVDIGGDANSAVPVRCDYGADNDKLANLSSDARLALSVLQFEVSQCQNPYILEKDWRKAFYASLGDDVSTETQRKKFTRMKKQLLDSGTIEYVGDKVFDLSLDVGGIDD